MKRRTLLAGVTSATPLLAGCSSGLLPGGTESDGTATTRAASASNGTATELPPAERVAVKLDAGFSKFDATFDLEVVRGPTADHPPRVGATFSNPTDRTRTYSFGAKAPLSPMPDEGAIPALYLRVPPEDGYDDPGCWQATSNEWPSGRVSVDLEPGEAVSNELDVLASPKVEVGDRCLPSGVAHFKQFVTHVAADGTRTVDAARFSLALR